MRYRFFSGYVCCSEDEIVSRKTWVALEHWLFEPLDGINFQLLNSFRKIASQLIRTFQLIQSASSSAISPDILFTSERPDHPISRLLHAHELSLEHGDIAVIGQALSSAPDLPIRLSGLMFGHLASDPLDSDVILVVDSSFLLTEASEAEGRSGDLFEVDGNEDAHSSFRVFARLDNVGFLIVSTLGVHVVDGVTHGV